MIFINAPGVTVDGFKVYRSKTSGICIGASNAIVRNCLSDWHWGGAIFTANGPQNILVEDSEFSRGAYTVAVNCNYNLGWCRENGFGDPATVSTMGLKSGIFRRIVVRDSYNEGMNLEWSSSGVTIENSKLYGNNKYQLYVLGKNHVVRHNLIYGTNTNLNGNIGNDGSGIWVSIEGNRPADTFGNHSIYGNFVANSGNNLSVSAQNSSGTHFVSNVYVYNNTFIAPSDAYNISLGAQTSNITLKNNIIMGSGNSGIIYNASANSTADYNLWSAYPGYVGLRGVHDPASATPLLTKITGWNSLSGGGLSFNDFKLQTGSPGINAGIALGSSYNSDYFGTSRPQGTAWDIGAHEYAAASNPADTTAPAVPSGLIVR